MNFKDLTLIFDIGGEGKPSFPTPSMSILSTRISTEYQLNFILEFDNYLNSIYDHEEFITQRFPH